MTEGGDLSRVGFVSGIGNVMFRRQAGGKRCSPRSLVLKQCLNPVKLSSWLTQRAAADHLGLSERTLIRLRQSGVLEAGICWRRKIPANPNSHVVYDVAAVDYALSAAARAALIEQDQLGTRELEQVR